MSRFKLQLEEHKKKSANKKELNNINENLLILEEYAHQKRPRCAYFDTQETLNGYYNIFHQIIANYGVPYIFYTDRRTIFEYKQKKSTSIETDTFTQSGYACKQLGVKIKTTSIPEAKGRVERMFQTLQSRLAIELRLAGITTIEEANIFLNSCIKEYNSRFALPINNNKSVFEE